MTHKLPLIQRLKDATQKAEQYLQEKARQQTNQQIAQDIIEQIPINCMQVAEQGGNSLEVMLLEPQRDYINKFDRLTPELLMGPAKIVYDKLKYENLDPKIKIKLKLSQNKSIYHLTANW